MALTLQHPESEIASVVAFLKTVFQKQHKKHAVIAVSGGIDSALSLTLLARALPADQIFPIFLPHGDQSVLDSQTICEFNQIPEKNIQSINIERAVKKIEDTLFSTQYRLDPMDKTDEFRVGNIMARVRMIFIFDIAKKLDALVCGTENKSEKYLAYFTRFGDEASDIEPIQHLYKTQVRQLAKHLNVPNAIVMKEPSAGLWLGQTDEEELGFSYDSADKVIEQFVDEKKSLDEIVIDGVSKEIIKKVITRIESQHFKHEVPYTFTI